MDDFGRQVAREAIAKVDHWNIGEHHAELRTHHDSANVIESRGQRYRDDLCFVADFSDPDHLVDTEDDSRVCVVRKKQWLGELDGLAGLQRIMA